MGSSEAETPAKNEKAPSQVQEQSHPHPYPDWAAVQAYYGSGMPPPYFGSPIAHGHPPPPYMWSPQHMMPPYGAPYAAIYPHGGIYAHPSIAMGTHAHGHVSATSTEIAMAPPTSGDVTGKSTGYKDKGLLKRLKTVDELSVSIGNGNSGKPQGGPECGSTTSGDSETEGSSEGTEDNVKVAREKKRKRSEENLLAKGTKDGARAVINLPTSDANATLSRPAGFAPPAIEAGKPVSNVPSASAMTYGLDFKNLSNGKTRNLTSNMSLSPGAMISPRDGIPPEHWMQDERELKKERRKQSNRESARRSRLRKQAETEELAEKVEKLNAENVVLRSELNHLADKLEKLRRDNAALKKLKGEEGETTEMGSPDSTEQEEHRAVAVENLLSRINNSGSVTRSDDSSSQENSSSGKLHQLLESNSRSDTVVAS